MIRKRFYLCLLVFCLTLSGCGGQPVTKSFEIESAESYTSDGLQAFLVADWGRAQWLFSRALSLYEGIDDQQGVLYSHINLAEAALARHHYSLCLGHLDVASTIVKQSSMGDYQARITLLYALTAVQQKQYNRAESFLQLLLPEFDGVTPVTTPNILQMAAISTRTKIAFALNKDEQLWTNRYTKIIELMGTRSQDHNFRLIRFQSDLLQRQGQYVDAKSNLQQALAGYKISHNRSGIAATLLELGQLHVSQRRWQEARNYLDRSIAVFRHLGDQSKVIEATENLVKVESALGDSTKVNRLTQWLSEVKEEQGLNRLEN